MIHTHDTRYYLKDEIDEQFYDKEGVDNLLNDLFFRLVDEGVILMEHSHDDRYYTKTQVHDLAIAGLTGGTGGGGTGGTGAGSTGGTGAGGLTGGTGGGLISADYYTKVETDARYYTKTEINTMLNSINQLIDRNRSDLELQIDDINALLLNQRIENVEIDSLLVINDSSLAVMVEYTPPEGDNKLDVTFSTTIEDVSGTQLNVKLYNKTDLLYEWQPFELSESDIGKILYFKGQIDISNIDGTLNLIISVFSSPENHYLTISNRTLEVGYVAPDSIIYGIEPCTGGTGGSGDEIGYVWEPIVFKCYYEPCSNPVWSIDRKCSRRWDTGDLDTILGSICPVCDQHSERLCIMYITSSTTDVELQCCNQDQNQWTMSEEEFWDGYVNQTIICPTCGKRFINAIIGYTGNSGGEPDFGQDFGITEFISPIKYNMSSYDGGTGGTGGSIFEITTSDEIIYSVAVQSRQLPNHPLDEYVFPGFKNDINQQEVQDTSGDFFDQCLVTGNTGGTGEFPRNIPNKYHIDFGEYSGVDWNVPFTGGIGGTGGTLKYNYTGLCSRYFYKSMITIPTNTWNITHNLESYDVIPICFDIDNNQIFPSTISYPTLNTMSLTFNIQKSGVIYCFIDMEDHMEYYCTISNPEGIEGYTHLPDIFYCPDCGQIFTHSIDVCTSNRIEKYGCPSCLSTNYNIIRNTLGLETFAGPQLSGPYDTRVFVRCLNPTCWNISTYDREMFFTDMYFKNISSCPECGEKKQLSLLFYNESIGYLTEYGQSYGYDLRSYPSAF